MVKTKEETLKEISEKCYEPMEKLEKEYQEILSNMKERFADGHERRAISKLVESYKAKLKSGGQKFYGYVYRYEDAKDQNNYAIDRAQKLIAENDDSGLEEHCKKSYMRISEDGKHFYKSKKDGGEFEIKLGDKIQRRCYGFFRTEKDAEMKKFVMYWQFNTIESAKMPIVNKPVEFRGVLSEKDGVYTINSYQEMDFRPTNMAMPSLDELIKKANPNGPMSEDSLEKLPVKTPVFVKAELYGYVPNPKFGDRMTITPKEGGIDSLGIFVKFGKDFDVRLVEGWEEGVSTCIWGIYKPYNDKNDGHLVKQIECDGLYVLQEDRPKQSEEKAKTEEVKKKW